MSRMERLKRGREEEEETLEEEVLETTESLHESKRLRGLTAQGEELLHLLEDVDSCGDRNLETEDLVNGVMRSLEEEIGVGANSQQQQPANQSSSSCSGGSEVESGDCATDSAVDLDYLLEASDDELGIPPTVSVGEESSSPSDCCADILENPAVTNRGDYDGLWQFEDQVIDYGLLGFEYDVNRFNDVEAEREFQNVASACMLFEQSDVDQPWRREAACGF